MTVKQMIAKLQKMPQNAQVYLADHDHGHYETNGKAGSPETIDFAEFDKTLEANDTEECFRLTGIIVKISVISG